MKIIEEDRSTLTGIFDQAPHVLRQEFRNKTRAELTNNPLLSELKALNVARRLEELKALSVAQDLDLPIQPSTARETALRITEATREFVLA